MKTPTHKSAPKRPPQVSTDATHRTKVTQGHPLERARPEERAHPSLRKAKHKHAPGEALEEDSSED
jgi:hypothetical protein